MPEGPEVECVKRELQILVGQKVKGVSLTELALKYNRYRLQKENLPLVENTAITKIERRGKFIVWWFDEKPALNHLGMTGGWIIKQEHKEQKESGKTKNHAKVILDLGDTKAIFNDIRNFGRFEIFPTEQEMIVNTKSIQKLGLDGLADPFPLIQFKEKMQLKRNQEKEIGALLLDQRLVAGIGNIYKSESLYKAKIHPLTTVKLLTEVEIQKLGQAISETLQFALNYGGSTIDNFQLPFGDEGKAQDWHKVYGKDGEKCLTCDSLIERVIQSTRSTFYCPVCQPLPLDSIQKEKKSSKKSKRES